MRARWKHPTDLTRNQMYCSWKCLCDSKGGFFFFFFPFSLGGPTSCDLGVSLPSRPTMQITETSPRELRAQRGNMLPMEIIQVADCWKDNLSLSESTTKHNGKFWVSRELLLHHTCMEGFFETEMNTKETRVDFQWKTDSSALSSRAQILTFELHELILLL